MAQAMREALRGLALMIGISWRADAARSVAAVVTAVGQLVSSPLRALGMMQLVDGVVISSAGRATGGAILVVGLSALHRLMTWASFNVRMRLRENTQVYLDARLMALTAGIPGLEHHERPEYLDKVELVRSEREHLANPFNPISWSVATILQMVAVLGLLLAVHPVLVLLPLFGVPSLLITFRTEQAHADLVEQQAEPNRVGRHLLDLMTGAAAAKEIRIFGLAGELLGRRRCLFEQLEGQRTKLATRNTLVTAAGWLLFAAGYVAAVAFAVHLVNLGRASVGAVVLVLTLGAQVNQQLSATADRLTWAVNSHRTIRRFMWLMDYASASAKQLTPKVPAAVPDRLRTGIRFEGVSFTYPGTQTAVLEDLDLSLPAGSTVAIVGDNGAGKTTLVKLLARFYQPTTGTIRVDGVDLRDFAIDDWRRRISAGFQDFGRLQLVARESIGVGEPALLGSDARVLEALDRAAAAELPSSLPQGLDTQLGRDFDGGVELSVGQWQKVALGRAMMRRDPLLLVLDEPTASLDAPTEHALFERFTGAARSAAARSGAITVLISHRFSTVRMADLILVVKDGRIAEIGDHATLLQARGLYAELFELQARAYR
jgi:ATP-binding cassette, subfamily B, bacterial